MTTLPERSPGVLLSALVDQAVAYDLVTETAHHLNASAGALLAADVKTGLATLEALSLVGRTTDHESPKALVGCIAEAPEGSVLGAVHPVLDWAITFRSSQPELLATIDTFLGTGALSATGTPLLFDVNEQDDGQVLLVTDYEWLFPNLQACLNQLTSVMNEYAVWNHTCASLHAGAVRSPTGGIVVLPANLPRRQVDPHRRVRGRRLGLPRRRSHRHPPRHLHRRRLPMAGLLAPPPSRRIGRCTSRS